MAAETISSSAESIVKSIGIPPQPTVIISIQQEMTKANPNMARISKLVSEDVGLSANVFRVASSPFIGLGKVTSIEHALNLMGIKNFSNLVFASALRDSLDVKGIPKAIFDSFWNHSLQIAKTATIVMKRADKKLIDEAYMAGLFHDCGVPLLIRKFPDYINVVDFAIGTTNAAITIEEQLYKTNHSVVGYFLAKTWRLSPTVFEAVLWHHSSDISAIKNSDAMKVSACVQLSENVVLDETIKHYKNAMPDYVFDTMTSMKYLTNFSWKRFTAELAIDKDDLEDIREEVNAIIQK